MEVVGGWGGGVGGGGKCNGWGMGVRKTGSREWAIGSGKAVDDGTGKQSREPWIENRGPQIADRGSERSGHTPNGLSWA